MRLKQVQLLKLNFVTLESGCIRAKKEKKKKEKGFRNTEERKGGKRVKRETAKERKKLQAKRVSG